MRIPRDKWPVQKQAKIKRVEVYLSTGFLVQVFNEDPYTRLSINRTSVNEEGMWDEHISWDEMMAIKIALGYDEKDAVEVYPPIKDVVYVANIRHLWIMPEPLPFAWRADREINDEDEQYQK